MEQYIDKSALVAELNRLISELVEEGEDTMFEQGRISALEDVKVFINHSLEVKEVQEEPISRTPADIEAAMQEVEEKSKAFTEAHQGENTDNILAQMRGEESVSEDLGRATNNYVLNARKGYPRVMDETDRYIYNAFEASAKWQKNKDETCTNDLEEAASLYVADDALKPWQTMVKEAFRGGAKWEIVKTLSDVKKAVAGKAFQFSMENVEAWGDDSNDKTIKLKGRVTFQVSNPESIIDALFAELENDN